MGHGGHGEDGQAGLLVLAGALLIAAVALSIQLGLSLASGPDHQAANGASGAPLVSPAADAQAKATLTNAFIAAQASLVSGSPVSLQSLSSAAAGISFTGGPSTGPDTVSVSVNQVGGVGPVTPTNEAVSMAARSTSGTCWYLWSAGTVPWYGARTNQTSCQAANAAVTPSAGAVSSSKTGWQQGGFPAA